MEKATRQQTKERNRDLVLKMIFEYPHISRAQIAHITQLTRTTVSDIVTDLIAAELVEEVGTGASRGGKSPILLNLVANSRYIIGLDLAQEKFYGAIVNLRGEIRELICLPVTKFSSDEALQVVYEILDQLLHLPYQPVVGIGVGTPGLINTQDGVVIQAVNLDWRDFPLGQLLKSRYQLPVYILNDCKAAAFGEYMYGNHSQSGNNMVVISVGHGIGAGIISNGEVFHGDGGGAGEIGHVVVVRDGGLPCRCGNFGCLETVASARAVIRRVEMRAKITSNPLTANNEQAVTLDMLIDAYHAGDPLVNQIVTEAGRYLGVGISNLVGALNIQQIILRGDMTRFGQPWLEVIRETASQNSLARLTRQTSIQTGNLKENGVILGASALLASNYSLLFLRG